MIIEYTPTLSDLLHAARENEKRQWRVANRIVSVSLIILALFFCLEFNFVQWYLSVLRVSRIISSFYLHLAIGQ